MNKMMSALMLSCQRATELMEKKDVVGLRLTESIALQMHTAMCSACKQYMLQRSVVDAIVQSHIHQEEPPPASSGNNPEFLERLRRISER